MSPPQLPPSFCFWFPFFCHQEQLVLMSVMSSIYLAYYITTYRFFRINHLHNKISSFFLPFFSVLFFLPFHIDSLKLDSIHSFYSLFYNLDENVAVVGVDPKRFSFQLRYTKVLHQLRQRPHCCDPELLSHSPMFRRKIIFTMQLQLRSLPPRCGCDPIYGTDHLHFQRSSHHASSLEYMSTTIYQSLHRIDLQKNTSKSHAAISFHDTRITKKQISLLQKLLPCLYKKLDWILSFESSRDLVNLLLSAFMDFHRYKNLPTK
jgi:hypothetical protein